MDRKIEQVKCTCGHTKATHNVFTGECEVRKCHCTLYSEPKVDKEYLNFEPSEEPQVVCPACDGSGIDVGIETTGCSCCNGTGKVQAVPVPYDELLLEIGTLKYLTEIRSIIIKIQEDAISKCHQSEANIEEQLTEIVCSQYTRAEKAEARIKELEIQTQSYGDCDEAIRADQNKKIGEWGNEPCPHRNNDFPFPKAVPTELQMLKHECRDCWQEKFGIAKFQKGEEVE